MTKLFQHLELFLQERKVSGLAARTLKDYQSHIANIAKRMTEGTEDYRQAVLQYLSEDISANTFNIRFAYIKCFFTWAIAEGRLSCEHPLKNIKKRKPVSRIVNVDNSTVEKLLELPNKATFAGLRDFALLLFSIDTGTRPKESLNLKASDFNFQAGCVTIPAAQAKTRVSRTVPISQQTVSAVKSLLSVHSQSWVCPAVFCSNRGTVLSGTSWTHIVKGYDATITPYCLRHIAALGMLRQGMNVFALRDMLGHSNISMTQKYLSLTLDDLRKEHSKASLLNAVAPLSEGGEKPAVQTSGKRVMKIKASEK